MPIKRIDHKGCSSHGWQAYADIVQPRYVSKFFADRKHGGKVPAFALAQAELPRLERLAARMRRTP